MNIINSVLSLFSSESDKKAEKQFREDLEILLKAINKSYQINPYQVTKVTDFEEVKPFLALENAEKIILVKVVLQRLLPFPYKTSWTSVDVYDQKGLYELLSHHLKVNLYYSEDKLIDLIQIAKKFTRRFGQRPVSTILRQVDFFIAKNGLTKEVENELRDLKKSITGKYGDDKKLREKIKKLLGVSQISEIEPGDVWSDELRNSLKQMEPEKKHLWHNLINHAFTATNSTATKKWLLESKDLIVEIGTEEYKTRLLKWFPLFKIPGEREKLTVVEVENQPNFEYFSKPLSDKNCELMKGLIWTCLVLSGTELTKAIGEICESAFKKLKSYGARSSKVGNACVYVLGEIATHEAVSQLENLRRKIKYRTAQSLLEKALEKAALKAGISREELEEISVSDYGLNEYGIFRQDFEHYSAQIQIEKGLEAKLYWFNSEGKAQKSIPNEIKNNHPEELKDLQKTVKEITNTLHTQREKFEKLYLQERIWDFGKWQERYLFHPLRQNLTKRLIWEFSTESEHSLGIWLDGKIVDQENREIKWLSESTKVKLWHPLNAEVGMVLVWRLFLEDNTIVQPFKQAHREIYVLTDAEIQTETYSNRFAAHILKQHQFSSLCQNRGWQYSLQGDFDSHNIPTLKLPKLNLEVEFWVEPNFSDANLSWSGICLYISTDQVRFYQTDGNKRKKRVLTDPRNLLKLEEIPPLIFSEMMRDVDLFVGVTSVGNDPNWLERGENGGFSNYWHDFSFGDLSASARTRREILERMIPRLKIASSCTFEDKFLMVKGDLRTYKIHLGSGNVLMSPNDQYLCIVPSVGSDSLGKVKVFLPFEGDRVLSIILSKALMLAEDSKIKDPTILRQIKR